MYNRCRDSFKNCWEVVDANVSKVSTRGKSNHPYSYGKDGLAFVVDKPAWFYGIRLFGDANGGEYGVFMESHNDDFDVCGTYTSNYTSERVGICHGFDVMWPKPLQVLPGVRINLSVVITGPNSYYGRNGKSPVEVDGVTVTFSDWDLSNGTNVTKGQIYELIISHCEDEAN